jgi:hypothetical protein
MTEHEFGFPYVGEWERNATARADMVTNFCVLSAIQWSVYELQRAHKPNPPETQPVDCPFANRRWP